MFFSEDGVEDVEQFVHAGDHSDLEGFTGGAEFLIVVTNNVVASDCGECGHVEGASHDFSAALDDAIAAELSAVAVQGGDADEGGGFLPGAVAKLGEIEDEDACGLGPDAGHGGEQVDFFLPGGRLADVLVEVVINLLESFLDELEGRLEIFDDASGGSLFEAVSFHGPHFDKLSTSGEQIPHVLGLFVGDFSCGRFHGLSEAGEDIGVDLVSFGEEPEGFGEVSDLARIDDDDRQAGGDESGDEESFVAPAGFDDDSLDWQLGELLREQLTILRGVRNAFSGALAELLGSVFENVRVEPILGHIDPGVMSHSGTHPCRYGLARGGPGDCSGSWNVTGRFLALPRPWRPRADRTRGRPAGCASFAALTTHSPPSTLYRHVPTLVEHTRVGVRG